MEVRMENTPSAGGIMRPVHSPSRTRRERSRIRNAALSVLKIQPLTRRADGGSERRHGQRRVQLQVCV